MIRNALGLCALVASLALAGPAVAQDMVKIRTYTQPTFTGFPNYVAQEMGFFKKNGIDSAIKFMPSGAPIVQAAAAGEWDMAFLGAPPAVIGGSGLGLVVVGVVLDETQHHQLIARPELAAKVKADPKALKGTRVFVTTLSTGHYMTEACLKKFGVSQSDVTIVPSEQTATLSAFAAGQGDLAQVWPPQSTVLRDRGNTVLCDGEQGNVKIPGVWVAHPAFLKKHPDQVAKWIRANLDAIEWMRQDFDRTYELYKKFDKFRGFNLSEEALKDETRIAMTDYTAQQQVDYMTAAGSGRPPVVDALEGIGEFFVRVGRLQKAPEFGKLVDAGPLLEAAKR